MIGLGFFFFFKIYILQDSLLERKENINVRAEHLSVASCLPPTEDQTTNPGIDLSWNQTRSNLLVNRMTPSGQDLVWCLSRQWALLFHYTLKTYGLVGRGLEVILNM